MKRVGLSPGKQSLLHATRIDRKRKYVRDKATSKVGKRQRLARKKLRFQVESTNEVTLVLKIQNNYLPVLCLLLF